jgi:hypothetical protein
MQRNQIRLLSLVVYPNDKKYPASTGDLNPFTHPRNAHWFTVYNKQRTGTLSPEAGNNSTTAPRRKTSAISESALVAEFLRRFEWTVLAVRFEFGEGDNLLDGRRPMERN